MVPNNHHHHHHNNSSQAWPVVRRSSSSGRPNAFGIFVLVQLVAIAAIYKSTSNGVSLPASGYFEDIYYHAVLPNNQSFSRVLGAAAATTVTPSSPEETPTKASNATAGMATTATTADHDPPTASAKQHHRLPTLDELTAVPDGYECPDGQWLLDNVVVPPATSDTTTTSRRNIPRVVHVTAKSRCVPKRVRDHLMRSWTFPGHNLYFHDDAAVYRLLEHTVGHGRGELVSNLTRALTCVSNGATLSDFWRYAVLYHYGGIYTDIDNKPGPRYSNDFITNETDAFFYVESIGTMSQYYLASSQHHPILLHFLDEAIRALHHPGNNVMVNNPAKTTGPGAVKRGMVRFLAAVNVTSTGYEPEGVYAGGLGPELESRLPWLPSRPFDDDDNREHPPASALANRTVTIHGTKKHADHYINRQALMGKSKTKAWNAMNMTHYHGSSKRFPRQNKISCEQHAARVLGRYDEETSPLPRHARLVDLVANYQLDREVGYYVDQRTGEIVRPWKRDETADPTQAKIVETISNRTEAAVRDEASRSGNESLPIATARTKSQTTEMIATNTTQKDNGARSKPTITANASDASTSIPSTELGNATTATTNSQTTEIATKTTRKDDGVLSKQTSTANSSNASTSKESRNTTHASSHAEITQAN